MAEGVSITALLQRWRGGDQAALDALTPVVYQTLQRLAARYLDRESPAHTWQPTDLVHEAFLQLADADIDWTDRGHFFAVAARQMRRLLVDHARAKRRAKRGGTRIAVTFDESTIPADEPSLDMLDLDRALERLGEHDPRKAETITLHIFGGLAYEEMARLQAVSPATIKRDLRFARAWLAAEMQGPKDGGMPS